MLFGRMPFEHAVSLCGAFLIPNNVFNPLRDEDEEEEEEEVGGGVADELQERLPVSLSSGSFYDI